MEHRTIIHVDLDAFFCAVEEKRDPTLHGKAFAVGGRPDRRGVVASCSYAARQCGVHSAMSMAAAMRLCPHLIVVSSRYNDYRETSRQVMAILGSWTPQLEQISIDEAFLDVTEVLATKYSPAVKGRDIAIQLQNQISRELGLSCSIGVASNKMVAKIATDCGKAGVRSGLSPRAICVVPPGQEANFLAPLPTSALWGVGPKMTERLSSLGIDTIGGIAAWSAHDLAKRFGRHGYDLSQHALGIDKRDIVTERESKSISNETTFPQDVDEWEVLRDTVQEQAESIARQLQRHHLQATTVKLKLRWSDFSTPTRQMTLPGPTAAPEVIVKTAMTLLSQLWHSQNPVRLLGVGVSGLGQTQQLGLWDETGEEEDTPEDREAQAKREAKARLAAQRSEEKRRQLEQAVALLQQRFGEQVVQVGAAKTIG